jgi:PAS domain-containing protein
MYEKKRSLWSSILEESVTCVLPVTPYRSFPASEVQISKCQRTILGIDAMMADTASLHVLFNSFVDRSKYPSEEVQFKYTLVSEEAVVSGDQIMARWEMTTTNAIKLGSKKELKKVGMLCARFNSRHKLVSLELIFDVMAFMLQLKQSARADFLSVVPNTVQTCVGPFGDLPMVMTLAEPPYTIVHANEKWEEMTGYKSDEVVGKHSCNILQGEGSEQKELDALAKSIQYQRPASIAITNYTREKKPFKNFFNLYPLSTDSKITHYVQLTLHNQMESENEVSSQSKRITDGNDLDAQVTITDNLSDKSSKDSKSIARISKDDGSGSGSSVTCISKST